MQGSAGKIMNKFPDHNIVLWTERNCFSDELSNVNMNLQIQPNKQMNTIWSSRLIKEKYLEKLYKFNTNSIIKNYKEFNSKDLEELSLEIRPDGHISYIGF